MSWDRLPPSGQEPCSQRVAIAITTSRDHQVGGRQRPPLPPHPDGSTAASPSCEGSGPGTCPFSLSPRAGDQGVRMMGEGGREHRTHGLKSSPLGHLPPRPLPTEAKNHCWETTQLASRPFLSIEKKQHFFSTHLPWVLPTARRSVVPGTRHLKRWVSLWCPFQNPNPGFCGFKGGVLIYVNKGNTKGLQKFRQRPRKQPFPASWKGSPVCFIQNQPLDLTEVNVLCGFNMIHEAPGSCDEDIYSFPESVYKRHKRKSVRWSHSNRKPRGKAAEETDSRAAPTRHSLKLWQT